jgi:hypothetical protein
MGSPRIDNTVTTSFLLSSIHLILYLSDISVNSALRRYIAAVSASPQHLLSFGGGFPIWCLLFFCNVAVVWELDLFTMLYIQEGNIFMIRETL